MKNKRHLINSDVSKPMLLAMAFILSVMLLEFLSSHLECNYTKWYYSKGYDTIVSLQIMCSNAAFLIAHYRKACLVTFSAIVPIILLMFINVISINFQINFTFYNNIRHLLILISITVPSLAFVVKYLNDTIIKLKQDD